jgi:hypothetical protein
VGLIGISNIQTYSIEEVGLIGSYNIEEVGLIGLIGSSNVPLKV